MQNKNTNGISLGEQMVVIAIVLVGMGLSIYGLATLAESKMQSTQSTVAYGYRAPSMPSGSVQSMPVYTPTVRHTSHHVSGGTYVSPRAYQSGHRSTSVGGGGYRVHERQFTSTGYAGGNGGGGISGGSTGSSSQTNTGDIRTASVSFAMPTIAMNSRIAQSTAMEESMAMGGPRRVYGPGVTEDGNGNYWDEEEEDWLPIPGSTTEIGTIDPITGKVWNGTDWVDPASDVNSPIGSLPVLLMLLLCAVYIAVKKRKRVMSM